MPTIPIGSDPNVPISRSAELEVVDIYENVAHNHVESDVTDLDKYTRSEVDSKIAQAGGGDMLSTNNLSDVDSVAAARTNLDVYSKAESDALGGGGVSDHGALSGLADDDHPQYLKSITGEVTTTGTLASLHTSIFTGRGYGGINGTEDFIMYQSPSGIIRISMTQLYNYLKGTLGFSLLGHDHTESDISDLGNYIEDITGSSIGQLADVNTGSVVNDDLLTYSLGTWSRVPRSSLGFAASSHTHTESQITDLGTYLTDITSQSIGQLADVNTGSVVNDDLLTYSLGTWSRVPRSSLGFAASSHTHTESQITDLGSYLEDITSQSIGQLADVNTSGATNGKILQYSLGSWDVASLPAAPAGAMFVNKYTIDYLDYAAGVTMLALDADDVVWDVKAEVTTTFNDSGLNGLQVVGPSGQYINISSGLTSTGWLTLSVSNTPDTMASSQNITGQYIRGVGDATQGQVDVYVYYSTF